MNELTGVVLCGGAGRRMGADKAMLEVEGRPLVVMIADRLSRIADPVLIASGARTLSDLGYPQLADARDEAGPLGGIVAALRATRAPLLAVVAVDMPNANVDLLSLLVRDRGDEDAIVPVDHRGSQPLHAVYARSALEPGEQALTEGVFSMRTFLERLRVKFVPPELWRAADPDGRFAFNLNSPEQLTELLETEKLRDSDG